MASTQTSSIVLLCIIAMTWLLFSSRASIAYAEDRVVYMAAIEVRGVTTADKEPYPKTPLPSGGGYERRPPNPSNHWETTVYQLSPATIVVRRGERLAMEIVGIHGARHYISIEKYHPDYFLVTRGEVTRVHFIADTPGIFKIHCKEHRPPMTATLVVLPR